MSKKKEKAAEVTCPECGGTGAEVLKDEVTGGTSYKCEKCGHEWPG